MLSRMIVICGCLLAILMAAPSEGLGSQIYFDTDADQLPDSEYTANPGEVFVVSVYLGNFTEETGSFQFDMFYDGSVLTLLDYDTYMGQPDEDPGLTGIIQTMAELGPWATSQWSEPLTQEVNEYDSGLGLMREFYTAGSFTQTATGDGILAYLVFEASGVGQTTLELEPHSGTWFLEDVTEQPTPINLTVTIIPEPAVLLLAVALALALARGHRNLGQVGKGRKCKTSATIPGPGEAANHG